MGRCALTPCIEPFGRLLYQVLAQEPYRSGKRLCWIVAHGSSRRGETAKHWLHQVNSHIFVVHTPVRASCLNQVEFYFSITQRKVLTPNDVADLEAVRIALYGGLSTQSPTLFQWKFDRTTLTTLLAKIEVHTT
jgi:hypothetical protein